jgi:transposase
VKPFVKRRKNDVADAEAICETSQRPTTRFVQIKSGAAQAATVVIPVRDLHLALQIATTRDHWPPRTN